MILGWLKLEVSVMKLPGKLIMNVYLKVSDQLWK